MKEICVVAPTKEIYELTKKLIVEQGFKNIGVCLGILGVGLKKGKDVIKEGAQILISRGGTYKMLKENCDVPIVEIKVNAYDLIEAFSKVATEDEVIGIQGFSNVISGVDIIGKFYKNKITVIELTDENEIKSSIEFYRGKGITTFIGDATTQKAADELCCKAIQINSGEESILSAINEALRILGANKFEINKRREMETVIDSVHDGVVYVDRFGKIMFFNQTAERIFNIEREKALLQDVQKIIPNTELLNVIESKIAQIGKIQELDDNKVIANRIPVVLNEKVIGAVASFQDITEISKFDQKIRRSISKNGFIAKYTFKDIIHKSEIVEECIETAKEYAKYDTPILIIGESGTGKELFCQGIHNESNRKNGPFVPVNCAAIPPNLIESEFFGYEEGAFTGAKRKGKEGVFELAHKGTIFLDEISELPLDLQGRLLRVLQEKQVMRLGGEKVIPVDVKIICASNKNLEEETKKGEFRTDLYYRIGILKIKLPSLKERKEDILPLSKYFMQKYSIKYYKKELVITKEIENVLYNMQYEGNVRQLEGIIEQSVILSSFRELEKQEILETSYIADDSKTTKFLYNKFEESCLEKLSQEYIEYIYNKTGRNVKETCKILGISRTTLWRKAKEIIEY